MQKNKIRVLIVDDSSIIRQLLSHILAEDPELEVVGTAPDPYVAREKLIALKPDIMTLDLEMPRMDGLSFLKKVMEHFPTRTVVISSLTPEGSELALRALEYGAIDVIAKPAIDIVQSFNTIAKDLRERVKTAARAQLQPKAPIAKKTAPTDQDTTSQSSPSSASIIKTTPLTTTTHQILAIAASTGGTEALKVVLSQLPAHIPGTVIVQHMPPMFTKTFAKALNALCPFEVKEAEDGDTVRPGLALLAPGNYHMELRRSGAVYHVVLNQNPPVHNVRPAADPLFFSVAQHAGKNAVGVILTGMGRDGAEGLLAMHNAGAYTIAQDEKTCVVFGMPKEAIERGAVDVVLPLHQIAHAIREEIARRENKIFRTKT